MKDKFGNDLVVGDIVMYTTRDSCFSYLNVGLVRKVTPSQINVRKFEKHWLGQEIVPGERDSILTIPERVVVIDELQLGKRWLKAIVKFENEH